MAVQSGDTDFSSDPLHQLFDVLSPSRSLVLHVHFLESTDEEAAQADGCAASRVSINRVKTVMWCRNHIKFSGYLQNIAYSKTES